MKNPKRFVCEFFDFLPIKVSREKFREITVKYTKFFLNASFGYMVGAGVVFMQIR